MVENKCLNINSIVYPVQAKTNNNNNVLLVKPRPLLSWSSSSLSREATLMSLKFRSSADPKSEKSGAIQIFCIMDTKHKLLNETILHKAIDVFFLNSNRKI